MSCKQCIRESRTDRNLTHPPLQNPIEHITAPEDATQIDLVPELPPSCGYETIVTAMDVFSRYLFAYPTSNQDAKIIDKVIINIMTKHAYLQTTLISNECTAFMSHVNKEVAGVLGISLKHATTKHAQTIGLLEQSHASIKQALRKETMQDLCGTNTSVLRSLVITLLITQVLAAGQAEFFTAVFRIIFWI